MLTRSMVEKRTNFFRDNYTTEFVYDGEDIILELDGNNTVKALFVHGEGIDDPLMMIRDENDNQIFEDKEVYSWH